MELHDALNDLASTITESQERIAKQVKMPYNTHLEWEGEMKELESAVRRLEIVVGHLEIDELAGRREDPALE